MNDDQLDNIPARILAAADRLHGRPYKAAELADACSLLRDMLEAAATHGVTLADFDNVVDLPQAAVMTIRHRIQDGHE
ncbi:hypothetical protein [Streptomyces microflavus]|uniref:hypothetical protein n=1 Tax=Streptomyces microflavus TaxID=1919 RepID=UPI0033CE8BE7